MQPKVVSARVDTPVQVAYQLMRDGGFRHLPVLDLQGKLVGILSDRDLRAVGAIYKDADSGLDELLVTEEVTVDKIMTTPAITVPPDVSMETAVKLMKDNRIGCLIVMEGSEIAGMLSYVDVLDAAVAAFGEAARPDQESGKPRSLGPRQPSDRHEQTTEELSHSHRQKTAAKPADDDSKR